MCGFLARIHRGSALGRGKPPRGAAAASAAVWLPPPPQRRAAAAMPLNLTAQSQIWVQEVKMTAQSQIWVQEVKMTAQSQVWVQEVKNDFDVIFDFLSQKSKSGAKN